MNSQQSAISKGHPIEDFGKKPGLPSALNRSLDANHTSIEGVGRRNICGGRAAAGGKGLIGFLFQKTITPLQFPGSLPTEATGVNDSKDVVGYFIGADGRYHGFLWTP